MKDVPGDTLISKMTIPGTHDSYAYQGHFVYGFARCQEWTVQVYSSFYLINCSRPRGSLADIEKSTFFETLSLSKILNNLLNNNSSYQV